MTKSMNYSTNNNDNLNDRLLIIALTIVCLIALIIGFIHLWYDDTHYSNVCYVDTITETETKIVDCCGNIWAVDTIKGAKVGDLVDVYFYNNGTDYTIEDDIITHINAL